MNLLLIGANGFVCARLVEALKLEPDIDLPAITPRPVDIPAGKTMMIQGPDAKSDWTEALEDQSVIFHAGALAQIMEYDAPNPILEYRRASVDTTLNLARQAAAEGVKRFVFISSIKVNGGVTKPGAFFTADDIPKPIDGCGIYKLEAERV